MQYVFSVQKQHAIMIQQWKTVFDKHKGKSSTWAQFLKEYTKYEAGQHDAPQECPGAQLLYNRAQGGKEASAAGSDAFAPKELKALPPEAWAQRRKVMQLMMILKCYPKSYYTVYTPAIPKKGRGTQPLDH